MTRWLVWGDYVHTLPDRIGAAVLQERDDAAARRAADANGFEFETRTRNGFEPWAAAFVSEDDDAAPRDFTQYPIVRGFERG